MSSHGNKRQVTVKVENQVLVPSRRSRLKRPPRDLGEWIRLANLVRPGTILPDLWAPVDGQFSWAVVVEQIAKLEDPLRSELLNYCSQERAEAWIHETGPQVSLGYEQWLMTRIDSVRLRLTLEHYDKIRLASQQLRMLSRGEPKHPWDALESLVSTRKRAKTARKR